MKFNFFTESTKNSVKVGIILNSHDRHISIVFFVLKINK